ncbi:MAG: thioredoxin [Thermoprotei archaeon]|nr:MAG: thioredoxin [Thermoprotei archaeon]
MVEDKTLDFLIRKKVIELHKSLLKSEGGGKMPTGVIEVDSKEFREILSKYKVVVADFWAEWCMPCRIVSPIIEKLARKYAGRAVFVKVNVDYNQDLAAENGILSIPTIIVYVNGREYERFIGAFPGLEKKLSLLIEQLSS